jgi:predicted AlkP superfamily phosphohydrolase/phosphomutase
VKPVTRREFLETSALATFGVAAGSTFPNSIKQISAPYLRKRGGLDKVIILGMDGMEPSLVRRFIEEGYMPNFDKFIRASGNHFGYLRTTMPPQSPVAWSSFISGTNPGGHGIFDFIHRDPKSMSPYLSTSRSFDATRSLSLGKIKLPLNSGKIELMRQGNPFWSRLEEQDIPSTVYQIPANFPVKETPTRAISGMGTPDLAGS